MGRLFPYNFDLFHEVTFKDVNSSSKKETTIRKEALSKCLAIEAMATRKIVVVFTLTITWENGGLWIISYYNTINLFVWCLIDDSRLTYYWMQLWVVSTKTG